MRHESSYAHFMRLSYQRQTEGYPPPAFDDDYDWDDDDFDPDDSGAYDLEDERDDYEYDRTEPDSD